MYYKIPINEVELQSINDYRLMIFSIMNNAALMMGSKEFQYQTEDEAINELDEQIAYYKNKGFFK